LAAEAELRGADRVVVIGERRGNPGIIRVYEPRSGDLVNIVSFIVKGVKLSREAGHPLPRSPSRLIARSDGSQAADEFADAMIRAFHAVVFDSPGPRDVEATIEGLDERTVRVSFSWQGKSVGPVLRLGKPAQMIKEV